MAGDLKLIDDGPDLSALRADFPALLSRDGRPFAYLDSAASAQKPQAVLDAMSAVYQNHYANIHRGLYAYSHQTTTAFEGARKKIAAFIGAPQESEIVFTRNATEAVNLVAQSWGGANLRAGDEIILTGMEHHANIVPWQLLRDRLGVVLRVVPVRENGTLHPDDFQALLSPRTRMVAMVHVSNALGTVNSIKYFNKLAKEFNPEIRFLADGSQAVVHATVNVADLGCDFYVLTGHKLYGPTGIGVLWGRHDVLAAMPPYQGGGDMIARVTFEKTEYKAPPARFEAGTPAIVEAIGLGAAVDYLSAIGMSAIAAHESELMSYAAGRLEEIGGLTFYGPAGNDRAPILSFTAGWGHPADIGTILDQCGVAVRAGHHCCQPLMQRLGVDSTIRASFGLYSHHDDVDALVDGLRTAKGLLS